MPTNPVRALRRLSQNFLVDGRALARILAAVDPQANDLVLEIGPGAGVLTAPLGDRVRRLVAIELDPRLAAPLSERFAGHAAVRIVPGDALELDWREPFADLGGIEPGLRVVANLPYAISSPTILRLLEEDPAREAHLMLQREFAQRLSATAGTKEYGSLTVLVAARARVTRLFDVPPSAFRPRPTVASSFVRLVLPRPRALDDVVWRALKAVSRAAFDGRRKRLSNSLARGLALAPDRVQALLASAGVDAGLRADAVAPEAYLRLAVALAASSLA